MKALSRHFQPEEGPSSRGLLRDCKIFLCLPRPHTVPRPPVHGGGRGGGDAVALALAHVHIVLAGPHQLLALGVLLLGGINVMT